MPNSLAQLTLRLTAPGVPDVYQGSELWDLSLVDACLGGRVFCDDFSILYVPSSF